MLSSFGSGKDRGPSGFKMAGISGVEVIQYIRTERDAFERIACFSSRDRALVDTVWLIQSSTELFVSWVDC